MVAPPQERDSVKPVALRLKATFWLDAVLLVAACALETVPFTGLILHEWLGLAFAALMVAHMLLSWSWISSQTRRLAAAQTLRSRVNYLLNLCLFACLTAVIFSGILISQQAIPALTRTAAPPVTDFRWGFIHDRLSDLAVILVSLHLAMNWDWMLAAARKVLGRRKAGAR